MVRLATPKDKVPPVILRRWAVRLGVDRGCGIFANRGIALYSARVVRLHDTREGPCAMIAIVVTVVPEGSYTSADEKPEDARWATEMMVMESVGMHNVSQVDSEMT